MEIVLLNFFIYTPGIQTWIGVCHPPVFVWAFGVAVALLLLIYNEVFFYRLAYKIQAKVVFFCSYIVGEGKK